MRRLGRMAVTGALLVAAAAAAQKPKLAVLEFTKAGELDPQLAGVLGESVATVLASQGNFDVVTSREIAALLGLERQKALLGCGDDGASCMAELGNALGAKYVLTGSVARLGESYQLNLQSLDSVTGQVLGRTSYAAKTIEELRAGLPFVVARATNTPVPEPPSRLPGGVMMGGGALVLVAGGLFGLGALNREVQMQKELSLGLTAPVVLKSLSYYQDEAAQLRRDKVVALTAMSVGAALLVGGFILLPKVPLAATQAALVPADRGLAVVGTW